jgi:hypothetical protein
VPIEQNRVGKVTTELMVDVLDQQYEYGEDAEITDVLLIVCVDNGQGRITTHYNGGGMPPHVAIGMCETVRHAMLNPS